MSFLNIDQVVDHILERISANALEINWRSTANISSASQRKGNRKGPGFEQDGFKEYDPADGDLANHIDFNASAAESEDDTFIVKVYKRPRVTCLTVLLDVNESMNTGTLSFKNYLGAIAAGCGIKAAEKSRDRCSFVTFAEQPLTIFKLMNPMKLFMQAIYAAIEDRRLPHSLNEEAADWRSRLMAKIRRAWQNAISRLHRIFSQELLTAKPVDGGGLSLALQVTQRALRSVYMVVSDFVNMNEEDWDALQSLGGVHDVIAVYVQDERERQLPMAPWPGMYFSLVDYRGERVSFWIAPNRSPLWVLKSLRWIFGSVTTRQQFADNFKRYEEEILKRLQDCGVTTVVVRTDDEEEAMQKLLQVLASKSRS